MICYQDRTFCVTPGCTKEHALTKEIEEAAHRAGLMISAAGLCNSTEKRVVTCKWCKETMPDDPGAYYHEKDCHRRDVARRIDEAERMEVGPDQYQLLARLERELFQASYTGD